MILPLTRHFQDIAGVNAFSTHVGFDVNTLPEKVIIPTQTHSANVKTIMGRGFPTPADSLADTDALVTNLPGVMLCIRTADCLPLLMIDPEARVIGLAHCGWRGTVAGIAAKTLAAMESLGARAERIIAAVGPHICPECFEVGEEVACQFPEQAVIRRPGRKPHVSLLRAVQLQLPRVSFQVTLSCSKELPHYFSVRRQGPTLPHRTLTCLTLLAPILL